MNEYFFNVNFEKGKIKTDLKELVQNDYNSTKINFTFDKEGRVLFKIKFPDGTSFVDDIENNEYILTPGMLSQTGDYVVEISLYTTDGRLTDYATKEFYVRAELVNENEAAELDDRIPVLSGLINDMNGALEDMSDVMEELDAAIDETNNLDLDVSKEGKVATVTLTKKDATTKVVTLSDGTNLMFNWQGTSLGIKTDEDEDYTYVDLQGIQGPVGATPNIQIGTVVQGSSMAVTRTGTNENPIFNFTLVKGDKGDTGNTGATGNGISSIAKTSTSGYVDTYTITYTDGTTSTFDVTNGEVSQEVFDALERKVECYKKYSNALVKQESNSATSLTINNTEDCPMELELSPSELEQETTTGTNYFNALAIPSSSNIVVEDNGKTITMPIISSGNGITATNKALKDLCPTLEVGDTVYLKFQTTPSNAYNKFIYLDSPSSYLWYNDTSKTITQNDLNSTMSLYGNRYSGGETEQLVITDFRIVNNDTDAFEKFTYGPSPNLDYPQDIHTITGDNEIKIENKNYFDKNNITNVNNKILNDNGEEISDSGGGYTKMYIPVSSNTIYTISGLPSSGTKRIYYFDSSKVFISRTSGFSGTSTTITTPNNCEYVDIQYVTNGNNFNTYQVEKKPSVTPYAQHKEQTFPLTLGNLEYCKIGDYANKFFKNTIDSEEYNSTLELNKWYLKKNIGKVVLDGTQNITYESITGYDVFKYNASEMATSNIGLGKCNRYINWNVNYQVGSGIVRFGWSNKQIYLYNDTSLFSGSVDSYKNWLSTHNVVLYYILETPTYTLLNNTLQEQLDNLQLALSHKGQTNVSQTNDDLPFVMKATSILGNYELKSEIITSQNASISVTPQDNKIYKYETLTSLTITNPPSIGAYSIIFTSGSTATTTVIPSSILGLESFSASANTIYEINVYDNRAVVGSWEVSV